MKDFETLEQCKAHYVRKVDKYVSCEEFGHIDGMDGACWWCREMTPYQFEMCQDASWLKSLIKGGMTEEEGIKFIESRKQKDCMEEKFKDLEENILYIVRNCDSPEYKKQEWLSVLYSWFKDVCLDKKESIVNSEEV